MSKILLYALFIFGQYDNLSSMQFITDDNMILSVILIFQIVLHLSIFKRSNQSSDQFFTIFLAYKQCLK